MGCEWGVTWVSVSSVSRRRVARPPQMTSTADAHTHAGRDSGPRDFPSPRARCGDPDMPLTLLGDGRRARAWRRDRPRPSSRTVTGPADSAGRARGRGERDESARAPSRAAAQVARRPRKERTSGEARARTHDGVVVRAGRGPSTGLHAARRLVRRRGDHGRRQNVAARLARPIGWPPGLIRARLRCTTARRRWAREGDAHTNLSHRRAPRGDQDTLRRSSSVL